MPRLPDLPTKKLIGLALGVLSLAGGVVYSRSQELALKTDPAVEKAFEEGMQVWREPDVNNQPCAFCHSPDGAEIAAYDFTDEDIKRRVMPHLGSEGADKIVAFVHAVRKKYNFKNLLDPIGERPLQPGDVVLPGTTPQERDNAFALSLPAQLPTLAAGNVDSLEKATAAKDELLKLNAAEMRVGILFNRLSEDGFHGKEHATFAHWIPDTPLQIHLPWQVYFELQDQYLRDPSEQQFYIMLDFAEHGAAAYYLSQKMTDHKFRALLIYTHELRRKAMGFKPFTSTNSLVMAAFPRKLVPNPLIELGVFASDNAATPFNEFNFPDQTLAKKMTGPKQAEQMKQLRLPSLWGGWLLDQGLMHSQAISEGTASRVMVSSLLSDGPYPTHAAFFLAKKMVTQAYAPEAWNGADAQHLKFDFTTFLADDNFLKYEPTTESARATYRRFVANIFKMTLYLYRQQLAEGKTKPLNDEQALEMVAYLKKTDASAVSEMEKIAKQISVPQ